MEIELKKAGLKTIHYVSPSVWAWRKWRIKKIIKAVDLMLTLFPFEVDFYKNYGVNAKFVGHPLANEIDNSYDQLVVRNQLDLSTKHKTIDLLQGSRLGELEHISRVFIECALRCYQENLDLRFVSAMANEKCRKYFCHMLNEIAPELPIKVFDRKAREVIISSDCVLCASGTVTLECALLKRPMVVSYKVSEMTAMIALGLVRIDYCAIPNILLNKPLIPEFLQDNARVEKIKPAILSLLENNNTAQIHEFNQLHQTLKQNASVLASNYVINLAQRESVD